MIIYKKQDLRLVGNGIVLHGCNCRGVMGAGVALELIERWPKVRLNYLEHLAKYRKDVSKALGTCSFVRVRTGTLGDVWIANGYTQLNYGRATGVKYADPLAIGQTVEECIRFSQRRDVFMDPVPIYMPKVGCGLGGLNWEDDVLPLITALDAMYDAQSIGTIIYVCEK